MAQLGGAILPCDQTLWLASLPDFGIGHLPPSAPAASFDLIHLDRLRGGGDTEVVSLPSLLKVDPTLRDLLPEPAFASISFDDLAEGGDALAAQIGALNADCFGATGHRVLGAIEVVIPDAMLANHDRAMEPLEKLVIALRGDTAALFLRLESPHVDSLRKLAIAAQRLNCIGSTPTSLMMDEASMPLLQDTIIREALGAVSSQEGIMISSRGAQALTQSMGLDGALLADILDGKRAPLQGVHLDPHSVTPKAATPLGATPLADGVAFAIKAPLATRIDVCLFSPGSPPREYQRIPLIRGEDGVWAQFVPKLEPGQLYGYRIDGPYDPLRNLYFNPNHLVVDPHAKAVSHDMRTYDGAQFGIPERRTYSSERPNNDNASGAPLSVVIADDSFDWRGDRSPQFSLEESVIIELHIRGATMLHPKVPENLRGTYAGLVTDEMLKELRGIGNVVELLPAAAGASEPHLLSLGLSNFWNYNPFVFNAPESWYASTHSPVDQVNEVKEMIRRFHEHDFKVIVDVVYNHTAEASPRGVHAGPTISLRGVDGRYYISDGFGNNIDHTGCGNTLNMDHPEALDMVISSLRYWREAYHVDGFRFDLAPILGVTRGRFDPNGEFFQRIKNDPVLKDCLLIAEPWSLGPPGHSYQLGNFPEEWLEWNDKYRNDVRGFWRGNDGGVSALATRLFGSSDVFQPSGRTPLSSINFITAHDGFTLADLWSFCQKNNFANGEGNRDGADFNLSWNAGVEGKTDNQFILGMRRRLARASMATLMLSSGIPMIQLGDSVLQSQGGNNNPYCQDNATSWVDWSPDKASYEFRDFVRGLYALRQAQPALRRTQYAGKVLPDGTEDVSWVNTQGNPMTINEWRDPQCKTLGVVLRTPQGDLGDTLFIAMSGLSHAASFVVPPMDKGKWQLIMDTSHDRAFSRGSWLEPGTNYTLADRSLAVFAFRPA